MGKASREINPGSMTVNITETPKREELKMNNILTKETFLKAKAIWSAQQALKTGSEVEKYCNLKMKRNHQIKQGHFKFAKSRLINIEQAEQSGKIITDLINSHGIYTHCLLLDTFSPISFAIAKEYHNDGSIIDRPSVLTKHNSIDLSKTSINKFVSIIGLRHILGIISHLCSTCQKQDKRFLKGPKVPQLYISSPQYTDLGPTSIWI